MPEADVDARELTERLERDGGLVGSRATNGATFSPAIVAEAASPFSLAAS
jgi:hypothetical protein